MLLSGKRQARMLYERALQRLLPVCDALPIGGDAGRDRGRGSGRANAKLAKYHCWSRVCFFSSMLHVVLHSVADTQQLLLPLSSASSFSASADLMLALSAANSCGERAAAVAKMRAQSKKTESE